MADRQNTNQTEAFDAETLKRYLFDEAGETERRLLESRFFDGDVLFYELLDLENYLTDRYARNELDENDRRRFAASLKKSPERRAKLANAESLQSFIREESKAAALAAPEKAQSNFWERFAGFFGLNAANFQSAAAALLFLLLSGIGFLIYERQRDAHESARQREVETARTAELQQQEQALREQIKTAQENERNLQTELAEKSGQADILTEQLTLEQTEKARLMRELEDLKRQKTIQTPKSQPFAPTTATVILAPIGGKGGDDAEIISINQNAATVSATLQIPSASAAATFSVRLNSAPLAGNLKPRRTKSGDQYLRVVFPAKSLSSARENLLTATGGDGSRYNYILRRKKIRRTPNK